MPKQSTKKQLSWKAVTGITGLALIIILALIVPGSGLFQANLQQTTQIQSAAGSCQQMDAISLPQSPIPANTSAVVAISTNPENFSGPFTYAASSGELNDGQGNVGSYIQTTSKKVNYSGGDDGTMITIQAEGDANKGCLVTIPVVQTSTKNCTSIKVVTDPSPLPQDQSAAITIIPTPSDFNGTYLLQADSGQFQMQDADVQASGNLTKTLVTKSTNVLYNGGKSGEQIVVKALGENNSDCIATIPITK